MPAILFIIQNNLVYLALSLLDPPTFQLWACWKLIPAGIFSRVRPGPSLPREPLSIALYACVRARRFSSGRGARRCSGPR